MELFRFTNPNQDTLMEQGEPINELTSVMWVERYRDAGEFEIISNMATGIRETLPIGSFISHVDSDEIMIVENHEITDDGESDPVVTVTGRGFESYFENRVVGSDKDFPTSDAVTEYEIPANETWVQAVYLLNQHIDPDLLFDPDNGIPYVEVLSDISISGTAEARVISPGNLYSRLLELLAVDNLGVKTIRPGRTNLVSDQTRSTVLIHKGTDLSASVIFSHETGEIENADYLWSNKKIKNCAYVRGRWVDVFVDTAASGYDRRVLYVDASDIDQNQAEYPTGTALAWIRAAMDIRGRQALAEQKEVALAKAEISQEAQLAVYRTDYNVGDIVSVTGSFDETSTMRVSEYVEIEDETGSRGYPTLEINT